MPYIKPADRRRIDANLNSVMLASKGELTYAINKLMMNYISQRTDGLDYQSSSDVMASCSDAAAEWFRRIHTPYEVGKARSNGDCFQEFIRDMKIPTL